MESGIPVGRLSVNRGDDASTRMMACMGMSEFDRSRRGERDLAVSHRTIGLP